MLVAQEKKIIKHTVVSYTVIPFWDKHVSLLGENIASNMFTKVCE